MNTLSPSALSWLSTIFEERFGHCFSFSYQNDKLCMELIGNKGTITFTPNSTFTEASTNAPCSNWNAEQEGFVSVIGGVIPAPCMSDLPKPLIQFNTENKQAHVGYDILGLTYWMLNRIEEIGSSALDNHGRFPAISSHAFKHNYLERPIVDEWLNVLGQVIQKVWPNLELKQHQFSMKVSHDVDSPSLYAFKPWKTIIRMMGGHLIKRRDIKAFFQVPLIKIKSRRGLEKKDPHNTFDWIMSLSEKQGLKSAFYFICGHTDDKDADYIPEDPRIQALMQEIHQRGHEIGLHPSYGTYQKPELIYQEAERLRKVCNLAGVKQDTYGGRMHYLRWEHPTTLQAWEDADMSYDTTLSYADRPGFRCGTCFEYTAFNPLTQKQLKLKIRPLIAMECTIIAKRYMNLGYTEKAFKKFIELKNNCRKVKGCFTLLWHNSHFTHKADFEMYKKIIEN